MITAVAVSFRFSWALTLVTSSVLLFIFIIYMFIIPAFHKMLKQVEHADEKASAIASEVFGAIRMIVACGAEERMAKRYSGWVEEARRRGLKLSPLVGAQFSPVFFAVYATFGLSFWFGVKLFMQNDIANVGTVIM